MILRDFINIYIIKLLNVIYFSHLNDMVRFDKYIGHNKIVLMYKTARSVNSKPLDSIGSWHRYNLKISYIQ